MSRFKHLKKTITLAVSALTISFLSVPAVRAELPAMDPSLLLAQIAQYTYGTMQSVNDLPTFMTTLAKMAESWMKPDDSPDTFGFTSLYSNLAKQYTDSFTQQQSLQTSMMQTFFQNVTQATVPYANDLDFQTLFDNPLWSPDPRPVPKSGPPIDPKFNFLINASGLAITHAAPDFNWSGTSHDKNIYDQFYRSSTAAQTLNAYILSKVYADITAGLTTTEQALLNMVAPQVTNPQDPSWYKSIQTEDLGIVLRQILLFTSEAYVLQVQQLQVQRQILAATAAGNTLVMASSLSNESLLLSRAVKPLITTGQ